MHHITHNQRNPIQIKIGKHKLHMQMKNYQRKQHHITLIFVNHTNQSHQIDWISFIKSTLFNTNVNPTHSSNIKKKKKKKI
ncbi:hypothetical protein Patl1_05328 [Pistacia atlantica]|uniref:Uncharacterized protein n=1 Tax=Pistacia atlantica TaxID=434234 RepID=A0ACC1BT48_9ROSI|nr:hypothetical protein Patl1_05328 [Pistacia atlantica]